MLKGRNILLRPVKRSDISCFLKWFNDPEVLQYLELHLPMTEMSEEKYIEELGTTSISANFIASSGSCTFAMLGENSPSPP